MWRIKVKRKHSISVSYADFAHKLNENVVPHPYSSVSHAYPFQEAILAIDVIQFSCFVALFVHHHFDTLLVSD